MILPKVKSVIQAQLINMLLYWSDNHRIHKFSKYNGMTSLKVSMLPQSKSQGSVWS